MPVVDSVATWDEETGTLALFLADRDVGAESTVEVDGSFVRLRLPARSWSVVRLVTA